MFMIIILTEYEIRLKLLIYYLMVAIEHSLYDTLMSSFPGETENVI